MLCLTVDNYDNDTNKGNLNLSFQYNTEISKERKLRHV